MKKLFSGCGKEILVDEDDFSLLSRYTWHLVDGYARTSMVVGEKYFRVPMHRLITGMKKSFVDHANRNPLDNRKQNLRICTAGQNAANCRGRKNSFGFKGVSRPKTNKRYYAQISYKRRRYRSRAYDNIEDAARAYDRLAIKYHGAFAALNFPDDVIAKCLKN